MIFFFFNLVISLSLGDIQKGYGKVLLMLHLKSRERERLFELFYLYIQHFKKEKNVSFVVCGAHS